MEEMNKRLSNPEKIKRWAILINDLSIERGELTPNLKLKKVAVAQTVQQNHRFPLHRRHCRGRRAFWRRREAW